MNASKSNAAPIYSVTKTVQCVHKTKEWNQLNLSQGKHSLKNVSSCLKTDIYSYLETSGGQSSNLYLNVVHIFNSNLN